MKIIQNNIDVKKWEELLADNPYKTPFQTPRFLELINLVPGYTAEVIAVEEDGLVALCLVVYLKEKGLKGYFSKRAVIYGGPLLKRESPEVLGMLLSRVNAISGKRAIYTEIRNYNDYDRYKGTYSSLGYKYSPHLNFRLNLENKTGQDILASMQYNRRREINQSIKEGVSYHLCQEMDEVRELYDILAELYRSRVKLPLPGLGFFEQLFRSETGKIFIVKHEDRIIGGSFCLVLPEHSLFTMYYCGIRNYRPKIYPTHIAIWACVEYALANRIKTFDFMGAGKPGIEYGVRDYKEKFGGDLVEYGRFVRINHPLLYRIGKLGLHLIAKLRR